MFDAVIWIGHATVGVISTLVWLFIIIAGLIEFFDWITGADKRKQAEKDHMDARLEAVEDATRPQRPVYPEDYS